MMKRMINKVLKVAFFGFITIVLLGGGTFYVMAQNSKLPDSFNPGDPDATAADEIPMSSLIDPPSDAPVKTFNITAMAKKIDTGGGRIVDAWTYGGTIPGPELHVQVGDRVIVHLKNELPKSTTIHWHGVDIANAMDGVAGVTQNAVPKGGEFTYSFIVRHAGTYWYHSHEVSSLEEAKGLYGALIVEPKRPVVHYDKDYSLMLHDWSRQVDTINGSSSGIRLNAKPGDLVRLRIIDTANETHRMTLVGAPFKVIAMDGHNINKPTLLHDVQFPVAASLRCDIAFRMPEHGAVKLVNTDTPGFQGNIFTRMLGLIPPSAETAHQMLTAVIGNGSVKANIGELQKHPVFDMTRYGSPKKTDDELTLATKYDKTFEMKLGNALGFFNGRFTMKFLINGKSFEQNKPFWVKQGQLVKIHIVNNSFMAHPMHLHGHAFKVLDRNGVPLSGSPIYLNTLLVGKHESYDIAFVANNPGLWLYHCHNLNHAHNGMVIMVNYVGVTTPFRIGSKSGNFPS